MRIFTRSRYAQPHAGFLQYVDTRFIFLVTLIAAGFSALRAFSILSLDFQSLSWVSSEWRSIYTNTSKSLAGNFKLELFAAGFFAWFLALWLPAAFATLACNLALRSFTRTAQRAASITIFILLVVVSQKSLHMANVAWTSQQISQSSEFAMTFMLAAKTLLVAGIGFAVIVPYLTMSERRSVKAIRVTVLLLVGFAWLFADWQRARNFKHVHPDNLTARNAPTFVVFIPRFSFDETSELLRSPSLELFREKLHFVRPVVPVSDSVNAQVVSTLTNLKPYKHGIRYDVSTSYETELAESFLKENLKNVFSKIHFTNVGSPSSVAQFFSWAAVGTRCGDTLEAMSRVLTVENLAFPAALLPESIYESILPAYACSQKTFPLRHVVLEELSNISESLKQPEHLLSIWYLDPNPYVGAHLTNGLLPYPQEKPSIQLDEATASVGQNVNVTSFRTPGFTFANIPNDTNLRRNKILEETLEALQSYLKSVGLAENFRLILVGLGDTHSNLASVAAVGTPPSAGGSAVLQMPLSTVQIQNLVFQQPAMEPQTYYFESTAFARPTANGNRTRFSAPLTDAIRVEKAQNEAETSYYLARDIFLAGVKYAHRMSLCANEGIKNAAELTQVHYSPSVDADPITSLNSGSVPVSTCQPRAVSEIENSLKSDLSLEVYEVHAQ